MVEENGISVRARPIFCLHAANLLRSSCLLYTVDY
jgi:hypothetical protein